MKKKKFNIATPRDVIHHVPVYIRIAFAIISACYNSATGNCPSGSCYKSGGIKHSFQAQLSLQHAAVTGAMQSFY